MKPLSNVNKCLPVTVKPCRLSKPFISPAMSARRVLLKRIQRQELKKLQSLLPALSIRRRQFQNRQRIDELAIVEEACRYIDQLHATILARIQSGSLSQDVVQLLNVNEIQRIQQVHSARSQQLNVVPSTYSQRSPDVLRETNTNSNLSEILQKKCN